MSLLAEQILIYGVLVLLCVVTVYFYLKKLKKDSKLTKAKVEKAKEDGLFEPVSLHPFIDLDTCIGSAACIKACPEKDILGIVDGKATVINTTNCIGHGACFHDCPVEAISLRIGTERRGVDLPHVNSNFETNIKGVYIAGELGGMGLIKNSVEQGKQAIDSIVENTKSSSNHHLDLIIIGAGPAGISASLEAKKRGLNSVTLEQDSLGGTVFTYPRSKIVMTAPMDLPLYGKLKLYTTTKEALLNLWEKVISEQGIDIRTQTKVESIIPIGDQSFKVSTSEGEVLMSSNVLLAIGRRGSPRKLNIPGEDSSKVAYRLIEPEQITNKRVLIVGGGDSAIEAALALSKNNQVTLSYRKEKFSRLKVANRKLILEAAQNTELEIVYQSNLLSINPSDVLLEQANRKTVLLQNDLVYIFAGGELPTKFLQKIGVEIKKRFGYIVKKHN